MKNNSMLNKTTDYKYLSTYGYIQLFLSIGIGGGVLALIDSGLVKHSLDLATTLFVGSFIAVCIITLIITRLIKSTFLARVVINLAIMAIILYVLLNTNYGIFWLFIGPVVVILIESFWPAIVLLAAQIGLILVVQLQKIHPTSYENQTVITAIMSILLVSAGLLAYKRRYEKINREVFAQENKLEKLTQQLRDEMAFKDNNQQELAEALSRLSQQNKMLSDSREALTNVLEDEQELRLQLQKAKADVEKVVVERTAELQQEHARLRATLLSLPVGLTILDEELGLQSHNQAMEAIIKQIDGQKASIDMEHFLFDHLKIKNKIEACLKNQQPVYIDQLDIKSQVLRLYLAPIVKDDRSIAGVVIIIEDITEEKVITRSKEEFLSIASHELRTPLTAIRGNAQLLASLYKKKFDDKNFDELIDDIELSSERLLGIVSDYLETSSLEQGKISVIREPVAVSKVADDVLRELAATAKEKHLYLKLTAIKSEKLPHAYTDPMRLSQILINLISNAIHYTEKGGVTVHISTDKNDCHLTIDVIDTGIGIGDKNKRLLFRKFQKADQNILTRDWSRSTGLGLYISKLLAELMGGKLKLKSSRVGHGSTFTLLLPVEKNSN